MVTFSILDLSSNTFQKPNTQSNNDSHEMSSDSILVYIKNQKNIILQQMFK